jgi:Eukaryotic-type carbonic anhydrase
MDLVQQSPIDLTQVTPATTTNSFSFAYSKSVPLLLYNDGHTIKVDLEAGNSITWNGTTYAAKSLHFHAPSEHSHFNERHTMSMHIVHEGPPSKGPSAGMPEGAKNYLVWAVFLQADPGNNDEPLLDSGQLVCSCQPDPGYFRTTSVGFHECLSQQRPTFARSVANDHGGDLDRRPERHDCQLTVSTFGCAKNANNARRIIE